MPNQRVSPETEAPAEKKGGMLEWAEENHNCAICLVQCILCCIRPCFADVANAVTSTMERASLKEARKHQRNRRIPHTTTWDHLPKSVKDLILKEENEDIIRRLKSGTLHPHSVRCHLTTAEDGHLTTVHLVANDTPGSAKSMSRTDTTRVGEEAVHVINDVAELDQEFTVRSASVRVAWNEEGDIRFEELGVAAHENAEDMPLIQNTSNNLHAFMTPQPPKNNRRGTIGPVTI